MSAFTDDLFDVFSAGGAAQQQQQPQRKRGAEDGAQGDAKRSAAEAAAAEEGARSLYDRQTAVVGDDSGGGDDAGAAAVAPAAAAAAPPPDMTANIVDRALEGVRAARSSDSDAAFARRREPRNDLRSDTALVVRDGERSCLHDVAFPPRSADAAEPEMSVAEALELLPRIVKPAREFPFKLDPFQQQATLCVEKGESVLVSAHTSAGKTVVAEYAIACSLRTHSRVIYTSPIKALSNQKYRELYDKFGDVGLMTGDVTINPSASCLVMTTEILRSMLYRGSEVMREVSWVIFDEIHYMRDKERGVVWEETIILLPHKVRFVFLSATIPNAKEFAGWIAKLHMQPCHVIYTDYRPTPLQHFIFPAGGEGLHMVVDEKGQFREDNFQKALSVLAAAPQDGNSKKRRKTAGSDCYRIVKMIMERNFDPVIVFCFSKRECEAMALSMSKLDFNTETEKKLVEEVFNNAIDALSDDDKHLPQVESVLPLLKRGIGIHHSGLLPIVKEVIEILFQESLIKALFATETFSMGLNMPAKTVVFTSVRKFDGESFRWISSGEYIQMSGRAGRRGLDERGIVIMMVDEKMEPDVAKNMIKGEADPLNSQFYLSYNMLLNLLRVDELDPEYLMTRSFHQFQNDRALPMLEQKLEALEAEHAKLAVDDEPLVDEYYRLKVQIEKLRGEMNGFIFQPIYVLPFLQPGRLVHVRDGDTDWGWGAVVNFLKSKEKGRDGGGVPTIVDVLLKCDASQARGRPKPAAGAAQSEMMVVPVVLSKIDQLSQVRIHLPKDLRQKENRTGVGRNIDAAQRKFADGLPLLDPVEDMKITDPEFVKIVRRIESYEHKLLSSAFHTAPDRAQRYALFVKKVGVETEIKALRSEVRHSESMVLVDELKRMKRVLRRLAYTNDDNVIQTKGRVACEINTADELVLTEMMFNGCFNELAPPDIVALVSCLIFEEKSDEKTQVPETLQAGVRTMQDIARRIATVSQECKMALDTEEYLGKIKPGMMAVVRAWAMSAKFADVCKMTKVFEGSIIRLLRREEELLRQLAVAAKCIGNVNLENKFASCIEAIKRDIVFAASLYL